MLTPLPFNCGNVFVQDDRCNEEADEDYSPDADTSDSDGSDNSDIDYDTEVVCNSHSILRNCSFMLRHSLHIR